MLEETPWIWLLQCWKRESRHSPGLVSIDLITLLSRETMTTDYTYGKAHTSDRFCVRQLSNIPRRWKNWRRNQLWHLQAKLVHVENVREGIPR